MVCSAIFLALSTGLIVAIFPPFEPVDYLFVWLSAFGFVPESFIMLADLLMLCAGALLAYSIQSFLRLAARVSTLTHFGSKRKISAEFKVDARVSLTIAAIIILYWHLPSNLDAAVLSYSLHLLMEAMMLVAGSLALIGGRRLRTRTRHVATIAACKAMGIFGVYLLVTSGYSQFYDVYPLIQQAQLGLIMMVLMFSFEAMLIPRWLYTYFSN
jgi:cytochrome c oxidase assembly factor CtaG